MELNLDGHLPVLLASFYSLANDLTRHFAGSRVNLEYFFHRAG